MLTFFRKIRKRLHEGGSTSKYLLYAIGEIALVVIGILIALQINNWNENRKLKIEEKVLIQSIHEEFSYNLQELQRSIEIAKMIQEKCITLLKNTGSKGLKISRAESDSLIYSGLHRIITYDVSNGILDNILNSGKIQIITNDTLRNYLANWPSRIEDVKEDEIWAVDARNNFTIPFIQKYYSTISPYYRNLPGIESGFDLDYSKIYKMQEFENLINSHRGWNWSNERNYKYLEDNILRILELCEREQKL